MENHRELKIKLLKDVGNKAKDSVMLVKGNRAAKHLNKGEAKLADKDEPIKVIFTKEHKENLRLKRKVTRIPSVKAEKKK
jgi:hypothetical protein